jgi:uncharacterized membrane protein YfhO
VPQGASRVEFRYAPRAFPIGIAIACAGLLAFLVVAVVLLWRRRSAERVATSTAVPASGPGP